jgi:hypothetical protein
MRNKSGPNNQIRTDISKERKCCHREHYAKRVREFLKSLCPCSLTDELISGDRMEVHNAELQKSKLLPYVDSISLSNGGIKSIEETQTA